MAPIRRSPAERVRAWLVTGPAGHLWSVAADVIVAWTGYALRRARPAQRRLAGAGSRRSARR